MSETPKIEAAAESTIAKAVTRLVMPLVSVLISVLLTMLVGRLTGVAETQAEQGKAITALATQVSVITNRIDESLLQRITSLENRVQNLEQEQRQRPERAR